jgi:hypothetical protein
VRNDVLPDQPADQGLGDRARFGVMLMVVSGLLWAPWPAVAFLPLGAGKKVVLASVLFLGVQVAWWVGAALAGPAALRNLRNWVRTRLHFGKATDTREDRSTPSA